MYRCICVWLVLILLSGCTSIYVPPVGENVADLYLRNNSYIAFSATGFKVAEDCSGGKLVLSKDGIPPNSQVQIRLSTDSSFSFYIEQHIIDSGKLRSLRSAYTFSPKKNVNYIFEYDDHWDSYTVDLFSVVNGVKAPEPSFVKRKWRVPFSEYGSFCESP